MLSFLTLFLIVVLILVFFQDFKNRTIHVGLPIAVFLLSVFINYISSDLKLDVIAYNIAFISINIIGLVLYFSFKNKKFINPIDRFIGLGDIVFFLAITPLFNLKVFMIFFIFGLLFSLLIHMVFVFFKQKKTIPLAGYFSLFFIINVIMKDIFKINILF